MKSSRHGQDERTGLHTESLVHDGGGGGGGGMLRSCSNGAVCVDVPHVPSPYACQHDDGQPC